MIPCVRQRRALFATIPTVFKQLGERILTGIASGRGIFGVVPEFEL